MSNDTSKLITPGIKFTGRDGKLYETTGELRPPKKDEPCWYIDGSVVAISDCDWTYPQIILRELPPPAPPRRVPTDADALHRPRCWVRDSEQVEWSDEPHTLIAVMPKSAFQFKTVNSGGYVSAWKFCEIEDVPLGPVYHWRDATRNDLHQQFLAVNRGEKYWANTYLTRFFLDDIETGLRVLVEVGK
jgi:hypothetical protein